MAVSLNADATAHTTVTAVEQADLTTLTIAAGSNRVLIAALLCSGTITSAAINWDQLGTPQAMTLLTSGTSGSSQRQVYIFGLVAPTTGNLTLRATWTGATDADLDATCFNGCDQTGGTTTFPTAPTATTGSGSPASITVNTASGDATYSLVAIGSVALSSPTQTQTFLDNSGLPRGGGMYALSGGASDSHQWTTGGASNWVMAGQQIVQAGAGGGVSAQAAMTLLGAQ